MVAVWEARDEAGGDALHVVSTTQADLLHWSTADGRGWLIPLLYDSASLVSRLSNKTLLLAAL